MTTIEAKSEARRQAWIRAEAMRIASAIEAQKIVDLVTPNIQDKLKDWIRLEVAQAMKGVCAQVLADVKEHVKGEVANYCRSVFDSQSMEEDHFHMVQEQSDLPSVLGLGAVEEAKSESDGEEEDFKEIEEEKFVSESNLLPPDALLV